MRTPLFRYFWIFGVVLLFAFSAAAQTWRQVGPLGGDVQSLAAVPGSTRTLFLGTSDGHVFGSHDAGEHWELLGRIGANHDDVILSIVVDARSADTLYATSWTLNSDGGGVYRSVDAGHSWELIGLEGHTVRTLGPAPSNPDILIAGAMDGVYRSMDAGKTWERISPENHADLRNFDSIAIDPHDPNTIYAGTYHLPWKTVDGGKNWVPIHTGMVDDSDVMSITVDQNDGAHVFASACSGIYHSSDGGASWTKFKGIPKGSQRTAHILQDPKRPHTIYAATTEGLWKTSDDGAAWRRVTPASWNILSMVIDPEKSDRLILGTERLGIQVSDNGGQTYRASNQGFSHRRIVDAATDPHHPERALVVLTSSFEPLLETGDAGRTWTPLSKGLTSAPPRHVFASPDGWFAAPGSGGLMRYDKSSASWVAVDQVISTAATSQPRQTASVKTASAVGAKAPAKSATSTAVKLSVPFRARVNEMAFSPDAWYAAAEEGLFVSRDRGRSWSAVPFTPAQATAAGAVANASPVRAIRAGDSNSYVWALTQRELEISGDGGKTWIARALPVESRGGLHIRTADESTVVLASDRGVFISRDAGDSWRQANLSELSADDMTSVKSAIVVSTAKGALFVSRDAGKTWRQLEGPSGDSSLSALRSGESRNQLVAASATEGLFVLDMGSASSASADSVETPLPPKQ